MRDVGVILLIILLFVGFSLMYQVNQKFSYDQVQMLLKGFHASLTGEYLPFGNEASTMGNLPGIASSWVIGFPLQLYISAFSPVIFQLIWRVLGIFIFANALCHLFDRKIVVLGTFLFALSPWILYQTMLYNPAYLSLGAAIVLNCLVRLRNDRDLVARGGFVGRFFCSMFLVLAIGFCLQLHFSWPVLVAMVGLMWLRRDIKVSYVGVFVGIAIVALSLVPYVQEIMVNPSLLNNSEPYAQDRYLGYGLVHVYPILKAILYWFRFGSLLVTEKAIVPEVTDDFSTFLTVVAYAWIGLSFLVGGITVAFAAFCNYFVCAKFRVGNSSYKLRFIRGMTISAFIAVIIAAAASPVTLNFWQIAIIMPFALIPVLAYFAVRGSAIKLYVLVSFIFFMIANPLAASYSEKFDYHQDFRSNMYRTCLVGFTPGQCSAYTAGLSAEQIEAINSATQQDAGVIDRVINGHIPLPPSPEDIAKQRAEAEAAAAEAAAAEAAAKAAAESQEATESVTEAAVASDASGAAGASGDANDALEAQGGITNAAAPLVQGEFRIEVPANESDEDAAPSGDGRIIDQGQGASGELIIN